MRQTIHATFVILCSAGFISCSLRDLCDIGFHYDEKTDACVEDDELACGFGGDNCYLNTKDTPGIFDVSALNCDSDSSDEHCNKVKCQLFEEEKRCTFECDADKSYYHSINGDDSSECEQRCDCARDEDTGELHNERCLSNKDQIMACKNVIGSICENKRVSNNDNDNSEGATDLVARTYCVSNTDDFLQLDDWIRAHQDERLVVYKMNDEDIVLDNENMEQWEPVDLNDVHLYAFGNTEYQKRIVSKEGMQLPHGLFRTINNSMIANIEINLSVEGENAYGLLADMVEDSTIRDVMISGGLMNMECSN